MLVIAITFFCLESYNSRPGDPFFYSGFPSYFKLKAKIYSSIPNVERVEKSNLILKEKPSIEKILNEVLTDKKVSLLFLNNVLYLTL